MVKATFENLLTVIDNIVEEKDMQDYHAFILWFLRTSYRITEKDALDSICDGTRDKGVDAVILDPIEKHVTIIQSKYSENGNKSTIKESEVRLLAGVKGYFESRRLFRASVAGANPAAARLLENAYQAVKTKYYSIELVFLSTQKGQDELEDLVYEDLGFGPLEFTFVDYKKSLDLYKDSLRDYTPKTGHYDLKYNHEDNVIFRKGDVNSWVLNVSVGEIRPLVARFDKDLFRKNIRNFLGESKANKAIQRTLKNEPENFWFYNNGITILCDKADLNLRERHIRLVNPQVVNGCQTVTSIKKYTGELDGEIIVRIIESSEHDFIQSITLAQNTSNPVKARDFKSNDPAQVRLKRELKKRRYYYEIKRGESFSDMKKQYRSITQEYDKGRTVNNEKIAKILAAILIDPGTALGKGSEVFFDTQYEKIFPPDTSSAAIITAWWIDGFVTDSYRSSDKKFFDEENPNYFRNRAKYYVISMIYEAMKGVRNWEKKWSQYMSRGSASDKDWVKFNKAFPRISDKCLRLVYKEWKKSKKPINNYLQSTKTLDDIRTSQKDKWTKLIETTKGIYKDALKS